MGQERHKACDWRRLSIDLMPACAVTAVGTDQPGIVAAVTEVLVERGCNLEDTSMSILGGHFAMVMIVDTPEGVGAADLERDLIQATAPLGLVVAVRVVEPLAGDTATDDAAAWTVVVYGADHPGIVYGFAERLAKLAVNIADLKTRVTPEDPPIYVMVMEVTLPPALTPDAFRDALATTAAALGVECTVHPSEADIL
jgi:glycine cleavage system transcriptional repressor